MNRADVIVIDPEDRPQVVELASLLDIPVETLRPLLLQLRDRQIVAGRIDEYWRRNPEPKPRSRP